MRHHPPPPPLSVFPPVLLLPSLALACVPSPLSVAEASGLAVTVCAVVGVAVFLDKELSTLAVGVCTPCGYLYLPRCLCGWCLDAALFPVGRRLGRVVDRGQRPASVQYL